MNNQREPFWWPMIAPPLPNREDDLANGWPWVETRNGVSFIRTGTEVNSDSLSMTEWEVAINDQ